MSQRVQETISSGINATIPSTLVTLPFPYGLPIYYFTYSFFDDHPNSLSLRIIDYHHHHPLSISPSTLPKPRISARPNDSSTAISQPPTSQPTGNHTQYSGTTVVSSQRALTPATISNNRCIRLTLMPGRTRSWDHSITNIQ